MWDPQKRVGIRVYTSFSLSLSLFNIFQVTYLKSKYAWIICHTVTEQAFYCTNLDHLKKLVKGNKESMFSPIYVAICQKGYCHEKPQTNRLITILSQTNFLTTKNLKLVHMWQIYSKLTFLPQKTSNWYHCNKFTPH